MNDKERLNEIITRYKNVKPFEIYSDTGIISMIQMDEKDKDWLIARAEKVEQLQQEIASLKEALNESVKTSVALDNELQQAQVKIERCKEIFKDIREASSDIYALRKAEQALQELEGTE